MASILGDAKYYEPTPRAWYGAAPIGDKLYIRGGWIEDFSESSNRRLASVVEIYDPYLAMWDQRVTTGVPPPGLWIGGCTSLDETLLWYGGTDCESWFGGLHKLNATTLKWEELQCRNTSQGPMGKSDCGLVSFQGNKLGLFGGYHTVPTGPTQPGSTFIRNNYGMGWTNEFHLFHLQGGVWSSPPTTGSWPPPCAAFSFTAIDSHRAVLFGGNSVKHCGMDDVYIFNIQTMHWSKLNKSRGAPWPVGRLSHAACCLNYGKEHPHLLVSGGLGKDGNTLKDLWVLDVEAGTWKELMLPEGIQRYAHTFTPFNLSPGVVEVIVFGGCPKSPQWIQGTISRQWPEIAETAVVRLGGVRSLYQQCIMHIAKDMERYKPLLHHLPPGVRHEIEDHILRQENMKHFPVIDVYCFIPGV